jgi:hypothetical protein
MIHFFISKLYPHSAYDLIDENGKPRGKFSKKALKPYREDREREPAWTEEDRKIKGQKCEIEALHE